jgi:adenylate kinase
MNILLLGPQGSGKGTQAARIADEYGLAHVASGEMLRQAIAAGTELGRRVKPILDQGLLVPDELMVGLLRERFGEPDAEPGFVLDGFPRTMVQADALDRMLREIGRELSVVFELQIDDEAAAARLLRRAELEGRPDDTPEAIQTRLALYHSETEPLIEHYRTTGNVVGIDADRPVDAVFAQIQDVLEQVAVR